MSEQTTCTDCHSIHPMYGSREIYLCPRHAAVEALEEALEECANDLAVEVEHRYQGLLKYPSERLKYERDMKPVLAARAALALAKGAKE